MARIYQLDPVSGFAIDPSDVFAVDRPGQEASYRATQVQVGLGLLSQIYDPVFTFPPGSFGAIMVASLGTSVGDINSFVSTPGPIVETGVTVTDPVLTWTLGSMNVQSQSLAGPLAAALTTGQRTITLTGSLTATAQWTLTVTNLLGVLTRQASLIFGHYLHYGRGVSATLNAAAILALSNSRLSDTPTGDFSYVANPGSLGYLWFCYPDSWGVFTFTDVLSGFPLPMFDAGVVSVTNVSGHTRNFRAMRSLNLLNAAIMVRVS